jgi:hypothetical protein
LNHEAAEEKTMPTKLLLLALVTVSMAACTKEKEIVWQKPGATQEELAADQYSCENYVRQNGYYGGRLLGAINRREFYIPCMESHGYTARQE